MTLPPHASLHNQTQLTAEARSLYPRDTGALSILFGRELAAVDFENRIARFRVRSASGADGAGSSGDEEGSGPEEAIAYDLIVGADGAQSKVRSIMEATVPGFRTKTLVDSNKTYKTFLLPEAEGAAAIPGLAMDAPRRHLYVYGQRGGAVSGKGKAKPPPAPRVVAYKREDGMIAGMITDEAGWEPGAVKAALTAAYPTIPPVWVDRIEAQAATRAPSSFSKIVACSQLHGPRACLVGDAAHAMTSSLGQGCNTALESVAALSQALKRSGDDLDKLPAAYNAARLPDVGAMQRLELMAVLCLPGSFYGSVFSRTWARLVIGFASVLGVLGARIASIFSGKRDARPALPQRPAAAGAAGGKGGKAAVNPMFRAPWARQMSDPQIAPRAILRGMYMHTAVGLALVGLLVAAMVKGALLLLRTYAPSFVV